MHAFVLKHYTQMYFLCVWNSKRYIERERNKDTMRVCSKWLELREIKRYARRGWERRIWGRPRLHRGGSGMGPLKEPLMNETEWFLGTKVGLSRVKEVLGHRHLVICFISPLSCTASTLHWLFSFSRSRSSFVSPDILSLAHLLAVSQSPYFLCLQPSVERSSKATL